MPGLLTNPWLYAILSAVALVVGSAIGMWADVDPEWEAALLAIGGGSLVMSMAFELFQPAVNQIGKWWAALALLAGVATFGGLDVAINHFASDESDEQGWGLWASVTTDGIPENAAMGSLLASGGGGSHALAFLFALVVTNGSQSMLSAENMAGNRGETHTIGAWVVTALVVGSAVLLGYWLLPPLPKFWLGAVRSFAGGAILASLAGEIYPDAYQYAGAWVTFATATGFLVAFLL